MGSFIVRIVKAKPGKAKPKKPKPGRFIVMPLPKPDLGKAKPKPAPATAPAKTQIKRSNESTNVPALMTKKVRAWYALAVKYGYSDDKVRKQLRKSKKDEGLAKLLGKVLSPKVEVTELKKVRCDCPKALPEDAEPYNGPPVESPRGIKEYERWQRFQNRQPRPAVICNCPKLPTVIKRKKFPGYLVFEALLTDHVRNFILTTKGVETILMNPENIVAVDTMEAAELLLEKKDQLAKGKERKVDNKVPLKLGDTVKVAGNPTGAWFGQVGKVSYLPDEPGNMTTQVEFPLLGRPVTAAFDCRILELVKEE